MFHEGGTQGKNVSWSGTRDTYTRWQQGKTGLPLVDANMRELAETGEPLLDKGLLGPQLDVHLLLQL